VAESQQESHDRGFAAGEIAARLAGHDERLAKINGSMNEVAEALQSLTLAVQRLGDQAVARDATVVTTAKALKEAEEARRDKTEQSWTPLTRTIALMAGVATVVVTLLAIAARK
jgi:hypothetical protein